MDQTQRATHEGHLLERQIIGDEPSLPNVPSRLSNSSLRGQA
jgi:hypothetical protein